MARSPHPKKEIEEAVKYAEKKGWRFRKGSGHCWGRLICKQKDSSGCQISVWSTPKNEGNHASVPFG